MSLTLAAVAALALASDGDVDKLCTEAGRAAIAKFPAIKEDQLAVSFAFLDRSRKTVNRGSWHGSQPFYPASVVKLFYLAHACKLLQDKKLTLTPELDRALTDMIVDSANDATGLVLEMLTDTTGGPELPPNELRKWMDRRQVVNRWYASMGYTGVNACQKTWNEGPYGRERQGYGPKFELRNMLTADACVRLMSEIATRSIQGLRDPAQYDRMEELLARAIPADGGKGYQERAFTGGALPKGAKMWSKAGWTSTVRHDVAWVKLPDGREFVLAIFTKDHSSNEELVPFIASELLKRM